jgi:hypothetical protein
VERWLLNIPSDEEGNMGGPVVAANEFAITTGPSHVFSALRKTVEKLLFFPIRVDSRDSRAILFVSFACPP